jgi:hypothetical protein
MAAVEEVTEAGTLAATVVVEMRGQLRRLREQPGQKQQGARMQRQ